MKGDVNATSVGKIAAAVLTSAVVGGWCAVENRQLVTDNYTVRVRDLPESFNGKKVLHLSDLHKKRYGDGFNNLINSCAFCKPDLIVFTGDLFSRDEENLSPKVVLMQRLVKIAPVYYIPGNHEADVPEKAYALMLRLKREGVHVLVNRMERFYIGESYVNIYGAAFGMRFYKNQNGGYSGLAPITQSVLEDQLGTAARGECNILLAHTPLAFEEYAEWGADLTFSGHIHGGVIRLPHIGGLLSPERKFFPKYSKGVYEKDGAKMVVSAGLGKFRLMNPAQIVLVTLRTEGK